MRIRREREAAMEVYMASKGPAKDEHFVMEGRVRSYLPTEKNKVRHHIPTRATCPICGREEEGSHRALVACTRPRYGMTWPSSSMCHAKRRWWNLGKIGCFCCYRVAEIWSLCWYVEFGRPDFLYRSWKGGHACGCMCGFSC